MTNNSIRVGEVLVPVKDEGAASSSPSKQHMLSGAECVGGVPTDIRSSSSSITTEQFSTSDDSSIQCSSYANDLDSVTKGMASMGGTTILPAAEEPACSPGNSSSSSSSGNMLKKRAMSYSELKWTEAPLEAPTDLAESFHEVIDTEANTAPTKRLPLEAATTALLVVVSGIFQTFSLCLSCQIWSHTVSAA